MKIRGVEYPKWWWVPFMGIMVLLLAGMAIVVVMWSGGLVSDAEKSTLPVERGEPTLAQLDEAIHQNPQYTAAYVRRARLRLKQGDFVGASADIDQGLRLSPGDQAMQQLRAEIRHAGAATQH